MELMECPWCWTHDVEVFETYDQKDEARYYVECKSCCARGPLDAEKKKAIRAWNHLLRAKDFRP